MIYSKILVTGGAGFIGSNLVCELLDQGVTVLNVDKLTYAGSLDNLGEYQNHAGHHFFQEDICDREKMLSILKEHKPQAVIHLAAESHVDRSIDSPEAFIKTNVMGTYSILDAAYSYYSRLVEPEKEAFKFVHISTDEVFGSLGEEGVFTEENPYAPNSPYAASKASSDMLVRSYFKTYGFPAVVMNASNNYGPRQFPEKLIPVVILNALEEKSLPIYGNGQQVRDWLHVKDHVSAIWHVLTKGRLGESYCVGSSAELRNLEIVQEICKVLDEVAPRSCGASYDDLIVHVTDRPGHDYRYATDASKLEKDTGWKAWVSFDVGLRETILWYLNRAEELNKKSQRDRIGVAHVKAM